jgi:PIN domain nuclease of toxin-antitoxin system
VLSSVSVLEIAIKQASGRLSLDGSQAALVADTLDDGVQALELSIPHALKM